MSIATVLEVMGKQSQEEYSRFFEEYYDLVYRTAYSITRTPEDAEDVTQTIFLRLLRREDPPDLTKNPKGYFYRAAVNVSLQTIRLRNRNVLSSDLERIEDAAASTDEQSRKDDELDKQLWQAIAELNTNAAQILILRYIHNHSLAEIAKLVGTSRSTVAVSLLRSRARLKKLIRSYPEAGDRS
jgi:RNA polymerase sigma-70 factor (ECF subfamily)